MGVYRDHILPRLIDWGMNNRELNEIRERCLANLTGEVLEVGFGSGLNLPYYPEGVTRLYAVDPAVVGRKLARHRIEACPFPVEFVGRHAEHLGLPDDCVDHAVSTWTLCTIEDPLRALSEVGRVLRLGGKLHFAEHGRSPEARVEKWQDRLNPIHKRVAGGCHLNRDIRQLLLEAGFRIMELENFYVKGPKFLTYHYLGKAGPDLGGSLRPDKARGR